jgi:hypothetical protein
MGMFDTIRSSYNLGEQFTDTELQTKDIEEYGIGGTMSHYWLSPGGQLYYIDYSHTADFVELQEGDEGYNDKRKLFNFRWIPNGNHGKVSPWYLTKYIQVYPATWSNSWENWPTLRLHFSYGKLMGYEDITGQR